MPTVVYRAAYRPVVATAYYPAPTVAYSGYAVTTYRPWYGWRTTRLVPYTASYAAYPYASYYTSYYAPTYGSCAPCVAPPACGVCDTGCSPCSTCATAAPTVIGSGCASCAAAPATVTAAPYAGNAASAPGTTAPPRTFQEKAQKPAGEPELKPIPQTDNHLNSVPAPVLPDPRDRTAARTSYGSARVTLVASPVAEDGWQPARD
jgi:hypothetical protein